MTSAVHPSGHTVVIAKTSFNGELSHPTTTATLASLSEPTLLSTPLNLGVHNVEVASTPPSTTGSPSISANPPPTSSSDPDANARVSMPVAMIAGILAGTIAIVAAILVLFVVRRKRKNGKKKRRRRRSSILRELEAQNSRSGGGHFDDEDDGSTHGGRRSPAYSRSSSERRRSYHGQNHRTLRSGTGSRYASTTTRSTILTKNEVTIEALELDLRDSKTTSSPRGTRSHGTTSISPSASSGQHFTSHPTPITLSTSITLPPPTFSGTNRSEGPVNLPPHFPLPLHPSSPIIPTSNSKADAEDLPPAYDDVR